MRRVYVYAYSCVFVCIWGVSTCLSGGNGLRPGVAFLSAKFPGKVLRNESEEELGVIMQPDLAALFSGKRI